jgi:ATP-dependent RNA helicase DDX3X
MSETDFQDAPAEGFVQGTATSGVETNPEDLAAARAHGWMEDEKLDYEAFNAPTSETNPTWASSAKVYEWTGEEGDVGPPDTELEEQLFGGEHSKAGTSLQHMMDFEAKVEGPKQFSPIAEVSFSLSWSKNA